MFDRGSPYCWVLVVVLIRTCTRGREEAYRGDSLLMSLMLAALREQKSNSHFFL